MEFIDYVILDEDFNEFLDGLKKNESDLTPTEIKTLLTIRLGDIRLNYEEQVFSFYLNRVREFWTNYLRER